MYDVFYHTNKLLTCPINSIWSSLHLQVSFIFSRKFSSILFFFSSSKNQLFFAPGMTETQESKPQIWYKIGGGLKLHLEVNILF